MDDQMTIRNRQYKAIRQEYKFALQILGGLLLVYCGVLIGGARFSSDQDHTAYVINLFTSLLSIFATVFVIEVFNRRREVRQLQEQLVRDAGSNSNETAKNAVHQLKKQRWLEGKNALLMGADLGRANLQNARLGFANLQKARLGFANLRGADLGNANLRNAGLSRANLQGANLMSANLQEVALSGANMKGAKLVFANLQGARLVGANLQKARLGFANLKGADLAFANLQGADLVNSDFHNTNLDKNTILPDGNHWTPATDLTQFGCLVE